jgi:signal transduction histidine kinase
MNGARRSWVRRVVPAIGATLALGVIALLALAAGRARRAGDQAHVVADHIMPGQRALQEIERAVADLAVTAATRPTGPELPAARAQLDRAIARYSPDEGGLAAQWLDVKRRLVEFADRAVEDARRQPGLDPELIELRMDAALFALRGHVATIASRVNREVTALASDERAAMLVELALLLALAGACLLLLTRAARREERAFDEEEAVTRRLERTNADLEAFAGRIAHDLRGPLSPILAGSQLIESSPVSTEVRRIAERIERSARRLFAMIDALLAFTRLSGTPCQEARSDVRQVVEETLAGLADQASELRASFDVRIDTVAHVHCESEIAASILQNLVENALKYGLDGSSDRVVEVRAFDESGGVAIEVEDHGPGVPAHLGDRVFEPLIQGREARVGVGLGLATVRRLAEARGGSVELRQGSRGALFRVLLPRAEEKHAAEQPGA